MEAAGRLAGQEEAALAAGRVGAAGGRVEPASSDPPLVGGDGVRGGMEGGGEVEGEIGDEVADAAAEVGKSGEKLSTLRLAV